MSIAILGATSQIPRDPIVSFSTSENIKTRGYPVAITGANKIFLGSENFVKKMQTKVEEKQSLSEIPRVQRRSITQPLAVFEVKYPRNEMRQWRNHTYLASTSWPQSPSILVCIIQP